MNRYVVMVIAAFFAIGVLIGIGIEKAISQPTGPQVKVHIFTDDGYQMSEAPWKGKLEPGTILTLDAASPAKICWNAEQGSIEKGYKQYKIAHTTYISIVAVNSPCVFGP